MYKIDSILHEFRKGNVKIDFQAHVKIYRKSVNILKVSADRVYDIYFCVQVVASSSI